MQQAALKSTETTHKISDTGSALTTPNLSQTELNGGWLEEDVKAISHSCKQLIIGLKLWSLGQIQDDHLLEFHHFVTTRLRELTSKLGHDADKRDNLDLENLEAIPAALKQVIDGLLKARSESNDDSKDKSEKEGIENVKKVVISLLQELSSQRRQSLLESSNGQNFLEKTPVETRQSAVSAAEPDPRSMSPEVNVSTHDEPAKAAETLQLFLQFENSVKKVEHTGLLSLPALQMLFMETFKYTPGKEDFPDIYIQDPTYKVFHQLSDISAVKSGSILKLNADASIIDSLKRHFDLAVSGITKEIHDVKKELSTTQSLQRPRGLSIASLQTAPFSLPEEVTPTVPTKQFKTPCAVPGTKITLESMSDLQVKLVDIRREIAIVNQVVSESSSKFQTVLSASRANLKEKISLTLPPYALKRGSLLAEKHKLVTATDAILLKYGEYWETVEDMKTDIIKRGSYPSQAQIGSVGTLITTLQNELSEILSFIRTVKPTWKTVWEDELQGIVKEQQALKDAENSLGGVEDSIGELLEIFGQCVRVMEVKAEHDVIRHFKVKKKDSLHAGIPTVMQEIAGIDVDSKKRLDALEKMTKRRLSDVSLRTENVLDRALKQALETGLKKTGGIEETERQRRERDRLILSQSMPNSSGAGLV